MWRLLGRDCADSSGNPTESSSIPGSLEANSVLQTNHREASGADFAFIPTLSGSMKTEVLFCARSDVVVPVGLHNPEWLA